MSNKENGHHVVVIGAGFGGLYAVHELVNSNVDVTLIDRRNFHLFQPMRMKMKNSQFLEAYNFSG